jgi:hypothetical protein
VTSLLAEFDNNITENIILPKNFTLMIIRFQHQGYDDPQEVEGAYCLENIQRKYAIKHHKDQTTTIGPVLSDIKKIPYLQICEESRGQ